jgi:hypothetical protein
MPDSFIILYGELVIIWVWAVEIFISSSAMTSFFPTNVMAKVLRDVGGDDWVHYVIALL